MIFLFSIHIFISRPVDNEVMPSFSIFEIVFLLKPKIILNVEADIRYLSLKSIISFGEAAPLATR